MTIFLRIVVPVTLFFAVNGCAITKNAAGDHSPAFGGAATVATSTEHRVYPVNEMDIDSAFRARPGR